MENSPSPPNPPSFEPSRWLISRLSPTAVAGLTAGLTATLLLHPLDLIRLRLQVQGTSKSPTTLPNYRNSFHVISQMVQTEGARALYKGITPNLIGNTAAWGLYFWGYDWVKTTLSRTLEIQQLGATHHLVAAGLTGTCVLALTNPIWVVKTRMCLALPGQGLTKSSFAQPASSSTTGRVGVWTAIRDIVRAEGFRGLYHGFVPGLFGVSHGAVQFTAYERIKRFVRSRKTSQQQPQQQAEFTSWELIGMAASAKSIAAVTTYPYQVLRTRLQDYRLGYTGVRDCVKETWRTEGIGGFYRGWLVNVFKVLPHSVVVFFTYETVVKEMNKRKQQQQLQQQ